MGESGVIGLEISPDLPDFSDKMRSFVKSIGESGSFRSIANAYSENLMSCEVGAFMQYFEISSAFAIVSRLFYLLGLMEVCFGSFGVFKVLP